MCHVQQAFIGANLGPNAAVGGGGDLGGVDGFPVIVIGEAVAKAAASRARPGVSGLAVSSQAATDFATVWASARFSGMVPLGPRRNQPAANSPGASTPWARSLASASNPARSSAPA